MKKIAELVDLIDEELEGAKTYAEKYVDFKAQGKGDWSNKFKNMANDELNHALVVHDLAIYEINELNRVYTAPVEMQEEWDKSHKKYIEKTAWIKQMLAM